MRDLRVYVDSIAAGARADRTSFYTRRADGPYYRWLYTEGSGRWRYSRVSLSKLTLRVLSVAPWEAIPAALRDRLDEHYLE
jgi:hypothetical protein